MTVSEAIYLIVELKRLAAKLGHGFEPDWTKLRALGFSSTEFFQIEMGIDRHMRREAFQKFNQHLQPPT